jgi:hypothetical protein
MMVTETLKIVVRNHEPFNGLTRGEKEVDLVREVSSNCSCTSNYWNSTQKILLSLLPSQSVFSEAFRKYTNKNI